MDLRKLLASVAREVADEAERNPGFRSRLIGLLEINTPRKPKSTADQTSTVKRSASRRAAAVIDPISLARKGDEVLRGELAPLNLDQLLDIVAEYGMDTEKLVMKWRSSDRIIERIVEVSKTRAQKGSAFLQQRSSEPTVDVPAAKETDD